MGFKIFVGNLSPDATEQDLRALFAADDRHVVRIRIVIYPRGFAFVEMATDSDAVSAVAALDGADLRGQNMRVTRAIDEPRPDRSSRR